MHRSSDLANHRSLDTAQDQNSTRSLTESIASHDRQDFFQYNLEDQN